MSEHPITRAQAALDQLLKLIENRWGQLPNEAKVPEIVIREAFALIQQGEGEAVAWLVRGEPGFYEVFADWDIDAAKSRALVTGNPAEPLYTRPAPQSPKEPMRLLVDQEWLKKKIETDPDIDCEAGISPFDQSPKVEGEAFARVLYEQGLAPAGWGGFYRSWDDVSQSDKATLIDWALSKKPAIDLLYAESKGAAFVPALSESDIKDAIWALEFKRDHLTPIGASKAQHDPIIERYKAVLKAQPNPLTPGEVSTAKVLAWAVERWNDEVSRRPLKNIHRRSLDDTWRQLIRFCGGDDVALCGPAHDDLAALSHQGGE